MYVSINKQLISFQNCFTFCLGFARETVKHPLVSHVCAVNITLRCQQHVACELQVERDYSLI